MTGAALRSVLQTFFLATYIILIKRSVLLVGVASCGSLDLFFLNALSLDCLFIHKLLEYKSLLLLLKVLLMIWLLQRLNTIPQRSEQALVFRLVSLK
jgi:hypothetical protein